MKNHGAILLGSPIDRPEIAELGIIIDLANGDLRDPELWVYEWEEIAKLRLPASLTLAKYYLGLTASLDSTLNPSVVDLFYNYGLSLNSDVGRGAALIGISLVRRRLTKLAGNATANKLDRVKLRRMINGLFPKDYGDFIAPSDKLNFLNVFGHPAATDTRSVKAWLLKIPK
ncbi:hypothetical protein M1295_00330 [Patescibacteria group bacterium]|nr:hypothetical protein [Patescibacteria group bacterium]